LKNSLVERAMDGSAQPSSGLVASMPLVTWQVAMASDKIGGRMFAATRTRRQRWKGVISSR